MNEPLLLYVMSPLYTMVGHHIMIAAGHIVNLCLYDYNRLYETDIHYNGFLCHMNEPHLLHVSAMVCMWSRHLLQQPV